MKCTIEDVKVNDRISFYETSGKKLKRIKCIWTVKEKELHAIGEDKFYIALDTQVINQPTILYYRIHLVHSSGESWMHGWTLDVPVYKHLPRIKKQNL